mmetsp:Transcript_23371/g.70010  ORF Transcript_23371/g.70010 Transcript_23371/m.70010 type:complete len:178 (+) Transcript_23371:179-712(+)
MTSSSRSSSTASRAAAGPCASGAPGGKQASSARAGEAAPRPWKREARPSTGAASALGASPVLDTRRSSDRYGRGKALRRCLKVEGGKLSWGSKKAEGAATTAVPVAEIREVVQTAFDDAPPGMDEECMLCFNVSNRAGLKIIADSRTDAVVLMHGFGLLCDRLRHNPPVELSTLPPG